MNIEGLTRVQVARLLIEEGYLDPEKVAFTFPDQSKVINVMSDRPEEIDSDTIQGILDGHYVLNVL